jgi:anthranilate/para-aminobenzoate synthase component I
VTGPDRDTFIRLATEHGVVPVWREVLADLETPLSVYAKLSGDGPSFLLESAEHGERWGRYSFVGFDPFLTLLGSRGEVSWIGDAPGRGGRRDRATRRARPRHAGAAVRRRCWSCRCTAAPSATSATT